MMFTVFFSHLFRPDSKYYCLRFAEETGEVEDEFPSVDLREPIGKYEFPSYQMQETTPNEQNSHTLVFYTRDGFSKVVNTYQS